jgi:hypothetical protein
MNGESIAEKKEPVMTQVVFIRLTVAAHIVVPLGFGLLGYLHVRERVALSGELIVVTIFASLPFLLPLLALYIENISKNGLKLRGVPLSRACHALWPARAAAERSMSRTQASQCRPAREEASRS